LDRLRHQEWPRRGGGLRRPREGPEGVEGAQGAQQDAGRMARGEPPPRARPAGRGEGSPGGHEAHSGAGQEDRPGASKEEGSQSRSAAWRRCRVKDDGGADRRPPHPPTGHRPAEVLLAQGDGEGAPRRRLDAGGGDGAAPDHRPGPRTREAARRNQPAATETAGGSRPRRRGAGRPGDELRCYEAWRLGCRRAK